MIGELVHLTVYEAVYEFVCVRLGSGPRKWTVFAIIAHDTKPFVSGVEKEIDLGVASDFYDFQQS